MLLPILGKCRLRRIFDFVIFVVYIDGDIWRHQYDKDDCNVG